jgi:hypothetical protein
VSEKSFHYKRSAIVESSITRRKLQQKRSTLNIGLSSGVEEPFFKMTRRDSEAIDQNERTLIASDHNLNDSPLRAYDAGASLRSSNPLQTLRLDHNESTDFLKQTEFVHQLSDEKMPLQLFNQKSYDDSPPPNGDL